MTVCLVYQVYDQHVPLSIGGRNTTGIWLGQTQLWKVCVDQAAAEKHTALHNDIHSTKTEWIYENREVR